MTLHVQLKDQTLFFNFNEPSSKNAISLEIAEKLAREVGRLKDTCQAWLSHPEKIAPPARAVVVQATPQSDIWCSGGHLKEHQTLSAKEALQYAQNVACFLNTCDLLPLPVVFTMDGRCIGGGAELALGGDLRLATYASSLYFKQLQVGLCTGFGGTARLMRLVGQDKAKQLILSCAELSAIECEKHHIFHRVYADKKDLEKALTLQLDLWKNLDPYVFAQQKLLFYQDVKESSRKELASFSKLWHANAHKNFLNRFRNKSS